MATAGAGVLHVNVAVAGGSGDGTSWENAYPNLQDALADAHDGDQIWIAAGVYYPDVGHGQVPDSPDSRFQIPQGVSLYGGFEGTETELAQRDPARHRSILSGDLQQDDHDPDGDGITARAEDIRGVNARVVVSLSWSFWPPIHTSTLDGLVITGGDGNAQGGGLRSVRNDLVLARCEIVGNRATQGGGLWLSGHRGFMVNCVVAGNQAMEDGGGIYIPTGWTISGSLIFANHAAQRGGGLEMALGSMVTVGNSTITGNRAGQQGGGIRSQSRSQSPVLHNTIIWNNEAAGTTRSTSASIHAPTPGAAQFRNSLVANSGGSDAWTLPFAQDAGGNLDADPQFLLPVPVGEIPLIGYGGMRLNAGSPASGSGDVSLLAADHADLDHDQDTSEPQPFDLAGGERVVDGQIDMGTYQGMPGPAVLDTPPSIDLEPESGFHEGLVDFSAVFDATAKSFAVHAVSPPGLVEAELDAATGRLDLTVLPGAVGETRLLVAAVNEAGETSMVSVRVAVFPPVLFVDAAAGGAATGLSWQDAFPHLQDALALGGRDHEIWVAAGIQRPDQGAGQTEGDENARFILPPGVSLRGGFVGGQDDPAARSPDARTILSADVDENDLDGGQGVAGSVGDVVGTNSRLLMDVYDAPDGTAIDHLVFAGASGTASGGGLRVRNSALAVRRCDFIANQATQGAGAHVESGQEVTFEECTFQGNTAVQVGGGVRVIGAAAFTACRFEANESRAGGGGLAATDGSLVLEDCEFTENRLTTARDQGGALRVQDVALVARDCRFTRNSAVETLGYGGAIYGRDGTIDLLRCMFTENAAYDGGALYLAVGTATRIVQTKFTGNSSSTNGGAIYLREADLWVAASEFRSNTAGSGGAIYNYGATPEFHGCTFSGNDAGGVGGAIYNRTFNTATPAAPLLTHCIIWNNRSLAVTDTARASVGDSSNVHETRFARCLIANSGGSTGWNQDLGHDLGGNLDVDPQFLIPVEIGGMEGDLRLLLTSPAVDAGDAALLPADLLDADGDLDFDEPLPFDLTGNPRVAGAAPEIGAHEAEPGPALVGNLPTRRLEPLSGSHPGLFDAADAFDATATVFRIERVLPEDILVASIDPASGRLDVEVSPHQFGPVRIMIGATNAAGATSYQIARIDVFPSVVFVDPAATGLATGLRWDDAFPNLQDALRIPRIVGIPMEIRVAEGLHRPGTVEDGEEATFIIPGDTHLFGGFAGNETTRDGRDPQARPTILSGDLAGDDLDPDETGKIADPADQRGINALSVVTLESPEAVTLDGFTITAAANGGVVATQADLEVRDCRFIGNRGRGGGAMQITDGRVVVTHSTFKRNQAASGVSWLIVSGGAILANECDLTVTDSLFVENHVGDELQSGGSGGAIRATGGVLEVVDSRFERNQGAEAGGAIRTQQLILHIDGCEFIENEAVRNNQGHGGALSISGELMVIRRSTFTGNRAGTGGGAVTASAGAHGALIASVDFRGNSAYSGGALSISGTGRLNVANTVFSGNRATFDGGAVTSTNHTGIYSNCTFTGNLAHRRGGAFYYPFTSHTNAPEFRNSIFWNNMSAGIVAGPIATLALQSSYNDPRLVFSHCLVQGSGGSAAWDASFGIDGGGNIDADPAIWIPISPLDAPETGGNFRLNTGSPAINAGSTALLPDDDCDLDDDGITAEPLPHDRDGANRVAGPLPDLGAYESGGGPGAAGPAPRLAIHPNDGAQTHIFSAANAFDGTATSFGIGGVKPAGVLGVSIDPQTGLLNIEVPPGTMGRFVVILEAESTSGAVSHRALAVDVFPEVVFVDRTADGAGTGLSWDDAIPYLQDALALGGAGYSIWVAEGIHRPDEGAGRVKNDPTSCFHLPDGVALFGGFESGAADFAERDPERWRTVLSGDLAGDDVDPEGDGVIKSVADQRGLNADTVVVASGVGGGTVLDGFWITAAGPVTSTTEGPGLGEWGGGMLVSAASPVIRNCRFYGNQSRYGGGMALLNVGPLTVEGCRFSGNESSSLGGAVSIDSSTVEFRRCDFRSNRSQWGGALSDTNGHVILTDTSFSRNVAMRGGAVYVAGQSASIRNSLFHANTADVGGAIENVADVLNATHCTFTENTAWKHGGAVSNSNFPSENEATYTNCILWNNQRGYRRDWVSASSSTYNGEVPTARFVSSLVANSGGSDGWDPAAGIDGGGNIDADPAFIATGAPGMPPGDGSGFRLRTGSPAINAGTATDTTTDINGEPRPQGAAPDMGCFENGPTGPAVIEPRRIIVLAPGSGMHAASVAGQFDDSVVGFEILLMEPPDLIVPTLDTITGEVTLEILPHRFGRVQMGIAALDEDGLRSFATLVVDVVPDRVFVDPSASGRASGLSWEDAFPSLQHALEQAVTDYEIWVAQGTYHPMEGPGMRHDGAYASFKLRDGVSLYGGFAGNENHRAARDPLRNPTILSGMSGQSDVPQTHHLVTAVSLGADSVLDGFTLTRARGAPPSGIIPSLHGGAIYIDAASPTIVNCRFHDNESRFTGGAGAWIGAGSAPVFFACEFIRCDSGSNRGGAVRAATGSAPDFESCIWHGNQAVRGGAIGIDPGADVRVINATISGNTASHAGGGIWNGGTLFLGNSIVWNNRSGSGQPPDPLTQAASSVFVADGAVASHRHNILANSGGSSDFDASLGTDLGGNLDADPVFLAPADPYQPASDHVDLRLGFFSAALDAGDDSLATRSVDFEGNPRIVNAAIDMGAYEGQNDQIDSDGDGISDAFELAHTDPPSRTGLVAAADDGGDGLTNLDKYFFGLDPNRADAHEAVTLTREFHLGEEYLAIQYTANPWARTLRQAIIERTTDLGDKDAWSDEGVTHVRVERLRPDLQRITERSIHPIGTFETEFLRLRLAPAD